MRDPGNFGELAMITLPKYVQARFVILGMFFKIDFYESIYFQFARNKYMYNLRIYFRNR